MSQSVKLKDGSYIDASGVWDNTQGKTQEAVNSGLTRSLGSQGILETYNFPTSASDTSANASYTVQNDGFAFLYYTFADGNYSQFTATLNGRVLTPTGNITTGGNSLPGLKGALSFPVKKGDIIVVSYFKTFGLSSLELKVL